MKPRYELGRILKLHLRTIEKSSLNGWQKRTLFALSKCRTAELGGHIDECNHTSCGHIHISYNSCRNRHCPKCQGHKREEWIEKREQELLAVGYYHIVFTLPSELNQLALHNPRLLYGTLYKVAWSVIKGFGDNPAFLGAKTGMIAILHTWGQNLSLHPHLHCIVPAGGVNKKGRWKHAPKGNEFLFPVLEMSPVFRAQFVSELRKNGIKDKSLFDALFSKLWVIYAKKPFGNARSVVEYLGRYTHQIAISNHRIVSADKKHVTFSLKNYKKDGRKELLPLKTTEFIRRFALHILPKSFVRIRHFGFLSSTGKRIYLKDLQKQLGKPKMKVRINQHLRCPKCKKGKLLTRYTFSGRAPPKYWLDKFNQQNTTRKRQIKK
ncbi:MAG: IS91 family transposase [Flavobacteriales bacterium]|nr:IS91 family transposase [Flavobacteriales bacterium]